MMARIIIISLFSLIFGSLNQTLWAHQSVEQAGLVGEDLQANSQIFLRDAWYSYMQSHTDWSNYPTNGNGPFSFINYKATGRVSLQYTGAENQYYDSPWSLAVTYRIKAKSANGTTIYDQEDELTINYDPGYGANMVDLVVKEYPNTHWIELEVVSLNNTTGQNPLLNDFSLEAQIHIDRYFNFDPYDNASKPQIVGDKSADIGTGGDYQTEFYWSFVPGAEEYELQYVFVEDELLGTSQAPEDLVDFKNATRIITPDPFFKTHLAYESGILCYRVRAIGRQGEDFEHVLYGKWSHDDNWDWTNAQSPKIVFGANGITPYQDDLNWTYQITHAEYGRHGEVVSFFDGSGQLKQTVSKDNETNLAIVGETFLDHEGRNALTTLPVPVLPNESTTSMVEAAGSAMKFYTEFTQVSTQFGDFPMSKSFFDNNNTRHEPRGLATAIGTAGNYFSASNPLSDYGAYRYLPNGVDPTDGSFTYTRTLFDDNGRPTEQSGVGPNFRIGSDHTTRYFYDKPSQSKLDRLFGVEVGYAPYYRKTVTQDANGQLSVSYENLSGQVIATSLIGNAPKAGNTEVDMVAQLDADEVGKDIFALVEQPLDGANAYNPDKESWDIHYQKLVTSTGDYTFNYRVDLSTKQFMANCAQDNYACKYQLLLKVLDNNKKVFDGYGNGVPVEVKEGGTTTTYDISDFPITVNASNVYDITFTVNLQAIGYYTIIKELNLDQDELNLHLEDYQVLVEANPNDACFSTIMIGNGTCEGLNYADSNLNPYAEYATCEELLEVLIEDMAPGGQYFDNQIQGANDINDWLTGVGYDGPNILSPTLSNIDANSFSEVTTIINNAGITDIDGVLVNITITDANEGWDAIRQYYQKVEALRNYLQQDDANGWPLYKYHPEYPHYQWCLDYDAVRLADAAYNKNLTTTPQLPVMNCQNANGLHSIVAMDPYFSSSLGQRPVSGIIGTNNYQVTGQGFINAIICNYPVEDPATNNITQMWGVAESIAAEIHSTSTPTPQEVWPEFARLYLEKKQEIMALQRKIPCENANYAPYLFDDSDVDNGTPVYPDQLADFPRDENFYMWGDEAYCFGPNGAPTPLNPFYDVLRTGCVSSVAHIVPEVEAINSHTNWPDPVCTGSNGNINRPLHITDQRAEGFRIRVPDVRQSLMQTTDNGDGVFGNTDAFDDFEDVVNSSNPCLHGEGFYVDFEDMTRGVLGDGLATGQEIFSVIFKNWYVNELGLNNSVSIGNTSSCMISFPNTEYLDFESFYLAEVAFFECYLDEVSQHPDYEAEISSSEMIIRRVATNPFDPAIDYRLTIALNSGCLLDNNGNLLAGCYDLVRPCKQVIPHCLCQNFDFAHYVAEENGISNPTLNDIAVLYRAEYDTDPNANLAPWIAFLGTLESKCAIINNVGSTETAIDAATAAIEDLSDGVVDDTASPNTPAPMPLDPCFTITIDPCVEEEDIANYHSEQANEETVQSIVDGFGTAYRKLCLGLDPKQAPDEMSMNYVDREYHFTLYYYTPAGNLHATVPPEGVRVITGTNNDAANTKAIVEDINCQRAQWGDPNFLSFCSTTELIVPEHRRNAGRDNQMMTVYKYNSYNNVIENTSPDQIGIVAEADGELEYGTTRFIYDRLGRVRFSQNPRQEFNSANDRSVTYTKYDGQGRIIETGTFSLFGLQMTWNELKTSSFVNNVGFPYNTTPKREVTYTKYDRADTATPIVIAFGNTPQKNLRQRVASTRYFESVTDSENSTGHSHATYYSYDTRGNVETLLQEDKNTFDPNGWIKRMDYDFGVVDGLVRKFHYQKGAEDAFTHEYCYDANNRLIQTYTTEKGVIKDLDARAFYRYDGPMTRSEIGEHKVQGIDYVYNLQGWIKGVNSTTLRAERDGGNDGYDWSNNWIDDFTQLHREGARDAFGYSIHYFHGDYDPIHNFANSTRHYAASLPVANSGATYNMFGGLVTSLYNGNISAMQTAMATPAGGKADLMAKGYYYDQLHRIVKSYTATADVNSSVGNNNGWSSAYNTDDYHTAYSYDRNGNLETLNRNATSNSPALLMDDLDYTYTSSTSGLIHNRLDHVDDVVNPLAFDDDLDGQSAGNYAYDQIGNLIKDYKENVDQIVWRIDGKVKEIIHQVDPTVTTNPADIEFRYDTQGNRIEKISKPRDAAGALLPENHWTSTLYVRDAQGNVIATYDRAYQYHTPLSIPDLSRYNGEEYLVVKEGTTIPDPLNIAGLTELNLAGSAPSGWTDQYTETTRLKEVHLYGKSRIGVKNKNKLLKLVAFRTSMNFGQFDVGMISELNAYSVQQASSIHERTLGEKYYELSNHLGNVLAVVTDKPLSISTNGTDWDHYEADVVSANDYYPFGLGMPGRKFDSPAYRYGFNGKEKDESGEWGTNTHYDYGFRIYNPAIARFLSVDPLAAEMPAWSTYAYTFNNPVKYIDPDGRLPIIPIIAGVWFVAEAAMSAYDAYDVYSTVIDPNATGWEKTKSVGLASLGLFLPGGGYSAADDIVENVARYGDEALSAVRGGENFYTKIDEATDLVKGINQKYNPGGGELHEGALSSAVNSASYYEKASDQGSAIFNSLITGHVFENGVKRTATEFITAFAKSNNLKFNLTTEGLQDLTSKLAKNVDEGGVRYSPEELSKILFKSE